MEEKLPYDFFEGDDLPDEQPKKETPEEIEERELERILVVSPHDKYKRTVFGIIAGIFLVTVISIWWMFYHPVVEDAQVTGRLMVVKCEGYVFKTYEGEMVSEQYVTDKIMREKNDFAFSIANDSLSREMMLLQNTGKKLVVNYKVYNAALPWRGKSAKVATSVKVENN